MYARKRSHAGRVSALQGQFDWDNRRGIDKLSSFKTPMSKWVLWSFAAIWLHKNLLTCCNLKRLSHPKLKHSIKRLTEETISSQSAPGGSPNHQRKTTDLWLPQLERKRKTNLHFAELVKLIFKSKDSNVLCLWLPQVEFMKYLFWNVLWQNPRQNNHTKMVISTRKTLWVTVQNSRKKNEAIDCYVSSWARRTLLRTTLKNRLLLSEVQNQRIRMTSRDSPGTSRANSPEKKTEYTTLDRAIQTKGQR